jgi:hypothetical protein
MITFSNTDKESTKFASSKVVQVNWYNYVIFESFMYQFMDEMYQFMT